MNETLEQLADYVRQNIPEKKALAEVTIPRGGDFVCFQWHATRFVVKKSLHVFELKGQNLLVTGASVLLQAAFSSRSKNERVIGAVIESMVEAENLLKNPESMESGLELLASVKVAIKRLMPPPPFTAPVMAKASNAGTVASSQSQPACVAA